MIFAEPKGLLWALLSEGSLKALIITTIITSPTLSTLMVKEADLLRGVMLSTPVWWLVLSPVTVITAECKDCVCQMKRFLKITVDNSRDRYLFGGHVTSPHKTVTAGLFCSSKVGA